MQWLKFPATADQTIGQEIQQVHLDWTFGLEPEVAGGLNQRFTKVVHPRSIDEHPRGQWIPWRRDRSSQVVASGSVGKCRRIHAGDDLEESSRNGSAGQSGITATENYRRIQFVGAAA